MFFIDFGGRVVVRWCLLMVFGQSIIMLYNHQKNIKNHQKTSKNINKHQKRPFGVFWSSGLWWSFLMLVVWSLVVFFVGLCWSFLMFFDVFWSILVVEWWSGDVCWWCLPDRPPCYKTIKKHQKPSKNINKHQQTSKKTIWCFQVIWSLVVFSDGGRLVFGGLFCWSFLMFVDVFWCFLMFFFNVFWSILVVKWWSGETRKRSIGPSSML